LALNLADNKILDANRNFKKFSHIELFAGGGGLALGLESAGFEPLLLNDFNKHACSTLKYNRPEWNVVCDDILSKKFCLP